MAESYVDYEMTGRNLGMCEHLDKEHFYRLTRGYFEAAVRNGSLYCAGDNREGYFIFETPETKRTLYGSFLQAKWMLSSFGLKKGIQYIKEIMNSGTYLASEFGRQKKPFTKIEFIAVAKEHQGQGYMRQMTGSSFKIKIRSDDLDAALNVASQVRGVMETISDIGEVSIDTEEGLPEVEIEIDRQRAYSFGVDVQTVAREINYAMNRQKVVL